MIAITFVVVVWALAGVMGLLAWVGNVARRREIERQELIRHVHEIDIRDINEGRRG